MATARCFTCGKLEPLTMRPTIFGTAGYCATCDPNGPQPHGDAPIERTFATPAARDAFLTATFPERRLTDVPGEYRVAGGWLAVYLEHVRYEPQRPDPDA